MRTYFKLLEPDHFQTGFVFINGFAKKLIEQSHMTNKSAKK